MGLKVHDSYLRNQRFPVILSDYERKWLISMLGHFGMKGRLVLLKTSFPLKLKPQREKAKQLIKNHLQNNHPYTTPTTGRPTTGENTKKWEWNTNPHLAWSHSGSFIGLWIGRSQSTTVGLDIESKKRLNQKVIHRISTLEERNLTHPQIDILWPIKESSFKALSRRIRSMKTISQIKLLAFKPLSPSSNIPIPLWVFKTTFHLPKNPNPSLLITKGIVFEKSEYYFAICHCCISGRT
ncbi:MAG: 4'-phosphopantetheinyl transferase superfamily protein, partial [Bdellovibrionaceae bacterium]|nr:4'-phosphopantetheinyl transferase superfamily protein [Pseudobdellovibrionaceae bacterium]